GFGKLRTDQRRNLVARAVQHPRRRLAGHRRQSGRRRSAARSRRMSSAADALVVEDLDVAYRLRGRDLNVLRTLSFRIGSGEAYGLVGESGCGKSTLALAAVRYLPPNGRVLGGRISICERDLFALGEEELRRLRTTTMSMVHQDPARALNPS